MSRKFKYAMIYMVLFMLIFQLFPQSSIAEEAHQPEEKKEFVLFADEPGDDIEVYKDQQSGVLVRLPDDTTVELMEAEEHYSLIRYVMETDKDEWVGYVHNSQMIPSEKAEEFRQQRLESASSSITPENEEEKPADDQARLQVRNVTDEIRGIARFDKTNVYQEATETSDTFHSYKKGDILTYQKYNATFYITTVMDKEGSRQGYIKISDVVTVANPQIPQKGLALKSPTRVYTAASVTSKVLITFNSGTILNYKTLTEGWFEIEVKVNGKNEKGYINKTDVETAANPQTAQKGVAIKKPTRVYTTASTASKVVQTYEYGTIFPYRTFTKGWHEMTVKVNGKSQTGYVQAADIGSLQTKFKGYALANPAVVYSKADRKSAKLSSYKKGTTLQYRAYNAGWYQVDIVVKGKKQMGYIQHKDVTDSPPLMTGYALKSSTYIYSSTSKSGAKLKTYKKGQTVKYRPYHSGWYTATVTVNGKSKKGYIHKNDVADQPPVFTGYAKHASTYVYSKPDRKSSKLRTYKKGQYLKYYYHNASWYKATVTVKGKKRTGYIHVKDTGRASDISFVNPNRVYSYNHMDADIKTLQKAYPDLIKYKVVGKSEYGRNIYAVSLGKGKATTFINGSHHAREWLTTNLNMYMIEQYAKAYEKNSKIKGYDVRKTLNDTTIWFIPMVNPDGVTLQQQGLKAFPKKSHGSLIVMNNGSTNFKRWKANGKGVDLNRQYNAGWATIKNSPSRPSYKNYKGKAPATASEVKAVLKLEAEIKPEMAVAYHTSGKILYWNFKQNSARYKRDHAYAKTIGKMTGYRLVYPGPNPSGGGFTDWFVHTRKRPGLTPEISRYVYETNPPVSEFAGAWRENQAVGLYVARESAKLHQARTKKK